VDANQLFFYVALRYRPGKMKTDADTLSRLPENMSKYMDSCTAETCQDELRAIVQSIQLEDKGKVTWDSSLTHDPTVLHGGDPQPTASSTPQFNLSDIRQAQLKDVIGKVYSFVNRKQRPTSSQRAAESPDTKLLLHEWPKLFIDKDGVLLTKTEQLTQSDLLPGPYHRTVLRDTSRIRARPTLGSRSVPLA
jgi:hypothetical protein